MTSWPGLQTAVAPSPGRRVITTLVTVTTGLRCWRTAGGAGKSRMVGEGVGEKKADQTHPLLPLPQFILWVRTLQGRLDTDLHHE